MKASVFEKTYQDYLVQIAGLDLSQRANTLGAKLTEGELMLPFLGESYRISPSGITNASGRQADFGLCVVLCKYILLCPQTPPTEGSEWVTFKDFKDAQPLIGYFDQNALQRIANSFSGKLSSLKEACLHLGGEIVDDDASYDLSMHLPVLPKIPVLLKFNDKDEEFPAQPVLLFQKSTEAYLDMECVAILGTYLAESLIAI
jgi:Domain of unknown function (DUF3786)